MVEPAAIRHLHPFQRGDGARLVADRRVLRLVSKPPRRRRCRRVVAPPTDGRSARPPSGPLGTHRALRRLPAACSPTTGSTPRTGRNSSPMPGRATASSSANTTTAGRGGTHPTPSARCCTGAHDAMCSASTPPPANATTSCSAPTTRCSTGVIPGFPTPSTSTRCCIHTSSISSNGTGRACCGVTGTGVTDPRSGAPGNSSSRSGPSIPTS